MTHDIGHSFRERKYREEEEILPEISANGRGADEDVRKRDELARELGVRPRCLYKWRAKLEAIEPGDEAARPSTHAAAYRKENLRLKRLLAEKTLEVDFFRGVGLGLRPAKGHENRS